MTTIVSFINREVGIGAIRKKGKEIIKELELEIGVYAPWIEHHKEKELLMVCWDSDLRLRELIKEAATEKSGRNLVVIMCKRYRLKLIQEIM